MADGSVPVQVEYLANVVLTALHQRVVAPLASFVDGAWPNAFWNIGYIIFIFWMYLFHAPFRVHSKARTDWYAQVTKVMQVWCGLTITLFHLAPRYLERQHEQQMRNPGVVFFPVFAASVFWHLLVHRYKRTWGLGVSYAATATILFLNALLVSLFLTVHYTYCEHNVPARYVPDWLVTWLASHPSVPVPEWTMSLLHGGASVYLQSNHHFWTVACPPSFAAAPVTTITHLVVLGALFVVADYVYKRAMGLDPVRGILWCDVVKRDAAEALPHPSPAGAAPTTPSPPLQHQRGSRHAVAGRGGRGNGVASDAEDATVTWWRNANVAASEGADSDDGGSSLLTVPPDVRTQPDNPPAMVPWYSTLVAQTAFQLFIGSNLNFLSFDYRGIEPSITPKIFRMVPIRDVARRSPSRRDSRKTGSADAVAAPTNGDADNVADELWFDWTADVGDGFNSTYEIARLMAQPILQVRNASSRLRRHQIVADAARRRISAAVATVKQRGRTLQQTLRHSTQTFKNSFSSLSLDEMGMGVAPRRSASAEQPQRRGKANVETGSTQRHPKSRTTEDVVVQRPDGPRVSPAASPTSTAAPMLSNLGDDVVLLPRGSFLLNGGDLAYPNPSDETYEQRLFGPYKDALGPSPKLRAQMQAAKESVVRVPPPSAVPSADNDVATMQCLPYHIATRCVHSAVQAGDTEGATSAVLHSTPVLFSIPGNHDWIDGLTTFRNYIIGKSWMGGWYMPQRSSYFVLELPGNWFFFCMDAGLSEDIDAEQLGYFMHAIESRMNEASCVVMCSHAPVWIYDSYRQREEGHLEKRMYKVCRKLGKRLRMRLCGDVHNYSRHAPTDPRRALEAPMLVVSGGGGAFLHGPRTTPITHLSQRYMRMCAFPSHPTVVTIATRLFGFRIVNWQFDFIGGLLYFAIIYSALPISLQPFGSSGLSTAANGAPAGRTNPETIHNPLEFICAVVGLTMDLLWYTWMTSHVSCLVCIGIVLMMVGIMEDKLSLARRVLFGTAWATLHIVAATWLLALLHSVCVFVHSSGMVSSSAGHWASAMETQVVGALQDLVLSAVTFVRDGLALPHIASALEGLAMAWQGCWACRWLRIALRSLDVLEGMTYLAATVAAPGPSGAGPSMGAFVPSATRLEVLLYYAHSGWFYWILATPVVSFIVGAFLLVSVSITDTAYDAAYSAFQIEDYKHFLRFRLNAVTRELRCYVVGVDRVPKMWVRDAQATQEGAAGDGVRGDGTQPPHLRTHPSVWKPNDALWRMPGEGGYTGPRIVETFTIAPHRV